MSVETSKLNKAPVDAFTPLLVVGGMVSRGVGADATQTLYLTLLGETLANAVLPHTGAVMGKSASVQETPVNSLVDIVAGMAGWFFMDWLIQESKK